MARVNRAKLSKKTIYRQLSSAAIETAVQTDGTNNWYIPQGNVRVNLSGYTTEKSPSNPKPASG